MKRLSTIRNILLLCATVLLGSCDLTETMQVEADKSMVFGSESGLRLYAYSFYRALPTLSTGYQQDEMCDIAAVRQRIEDAALISPIRNPKAYGLLALYNQAAAGGLGQADNA